MPLFREVGIINATLSVLNSLQYKFILIKYISYFLYFQQNSIIKYKNLLEKKVYAIDIVEKNRFLKYQDKKRN